MIKKLLEEKKAQEADRATRFKEEIIDGLQDSEHVSNNLVALRNFLQTWVDNVNKWINAGGTAYSPPREKH